MQFPQRRVIPTKNLNNSLRLTLVAVGVCIALITNTTSAFSDSTLKTPSTPADSSELRFRLTTGPVTLDWNQAKLSQETYVLLNLMEGLLEQDTDLHVKPALAQSWEASADKKTYTFTLRRGVRWSDGRQLEAKDFEDSWFRLIDPKLKCRYANLLFDIENAEDYYKGNIKNRSQVGIKAISPTSFQVRLKYPVAHFLHLTTIWATFPIRADIIQKHGAGWTNPDKMVALGPYLLTEWKPSKAIQLRKNPYYYNPEALMQAPDQVKILVERNDERARQEFERGNLDFLQDISTQDLLKFKSNAGNRSIRIEQFPYLATYYLAFNTKKGPLANLLVRKAIALAMDRQSIPSVLQGGEQVATSWFPPGITGNGENSGLAGSLYDAKVALAKAGYPEGQGFPRLQFWIEKFDGAERLGQYLGRTLYDRLGIHFDVQFGNSKDYQTSTEGALFLTHWGADYADAHSFLMVFSKNPQNYANWSHPTYDHYLERGIQSADRGVRNAAFSQAEMILIEKEIAIHPLFYRKRTLAIRERVERIAISAVNYFYIKLVRLRAETKNK